MKAKSYVLIGLFLIGAIVLQAQSGITIQSGGKVTVNGNTIIINGPLSLSLVKTDVACYGLNDGTITAIFNGGAGPILLKLGTGSYFSASSPYTFNNLPAGTYEVCVKDANIPPAEVCQSITIFQGVEILLSLSMTGVSSPGATDGTVTASFSGGSGNFEAKIDGGIYAPATSPKTFYGLPAGMHTVYTRDINTGCEKSASIQVTINPWSCGQPITDSRDGKTYKTVQIGTQCWMTQNLNIGTRIAGSSNQTNNSIIEKFCYNNDDNNCNTYGGLYQWDEAMQYSTTPGVQGICPTAWHLPTDAEWTTLTTFLGGESIAGGKMKSTGTTQTGTGLWIAPNTGATNSSSFTALPGGGRYGNGSFWTLAGSAVFWSSSQYDAATAWYRYLSYSYEGVDRYHGYNKTYGFSIRCLKD